MSDPCRLVWSFSGGALFTLVLATSFYYATKMQTNFNHQISTNLAGYPNETLAKSTQFTHTLSRCTSNPFLHFINSSKFKEYEDFALKHRLQSSRVLSKLKKHEMHGPQEFALWEILFPVIPGVCDQHIQRVGASGDGGKWICGLEQMNDTNCAIISLGCFGDFSFEIDILSRKKGCRTITFDCTGNWPVPNEIQDRATFKPLCYGVKNQEGSGLMHTRNIQTMMKENNIPFLHLIKMDIEGAEFPYFFDMFENTPLEASGHLPYQILVEIHYFSTGKGLDWQTWRPEILARLVDGWYDFGYRVVFREENPRCTICYEVTLLRFRC